MPIFYREGSIRIRSILTINSGFHRYRPHGGSVQTFFSENSIYNPSFFCLDQLNGHPTLTTRAGISGESYGYGDVGRVYFAGNYCKTRPLRTSRLLVYPANGNAAGNIAKAADLTHELYCSWHNHYWDFPSSLLEGQCTYLLQQFTESGRQVFNYRYRH
ncbi:hypothetical protein CEXT_246881 [Caerostris extrusa]|uniref:Uncharacterized protein n=1 Tax=Caerostris extrusa TaxID=172846 RepID=A0AAV4WFH8_CAEEX|nr:hypothetical protein CEXT_246881 [Caerostris extrusa]